MSLIVALPSTHPGGLEAKPSNRFGQCDTYSCETTRASHVTIGSRFIGAADFVTQSPIGTLGCRRLAGVGDGIRLLPLLRHGE